MMMTRTAVNVVHAFIIAPLLIYVGAKCRDVPRPATISVLAIGIIALLYHLYALIKDVRDKRIAQMSEEGFASCGAKPREQFASCGTKPREGFASCGTKPREGFGGCGMRQ